MLFGFVSIFLVRLGTSPSDIRAYTLDHHMHTRGMIKQVAVKSGYLKIVIRRNLNSASPKIVVSSAKT
ncbi:inorganic diphosphatase [Trifolium repens]|nr:inorganic diphosphatase [Trifolium repens]